MLCILSKYTAYFIVECLIDVDSKKMFTEHEKDVVRLLSTFADFE
jgi:hypothetical protein